VIPRTPHISRSSVVKERKQKCRMSNTQCRISKFVIRYWTLDIVCC
jgi:hypothetical protein